ncbi:tyrosine-type recombinase/integrase [Neoroseomonas oryzicola]|uniref:Tyrosine-type recombinase/integrase n=1 Tax=Neoroseomonas oryzicola TaxID=535904 RepID=A0A9X9WLI8_9PROT|nr:site-specific integrase [Neoroseomonas oryzicola]MBR0661198.1 tyrosine-type recombinase/integrase [Neoroseomonas oryzicola]NKE17563.1 tyrosine-type recombinase/integrase [Neoroseomonas oryzicola]
MAGNLTAVAVKNLTAAKALAASKASGKAARHWDGDGLFLETKGGRAYWVFRFMLAGRRRDMGLGGAVGPGAVSLAEARERAAEGLKLARSGSDPLKHRAGIEAAAKAAAQAAQARAKTFDDVAALYLSAHAAGWRNPKHRAQWKMTLKEYAGPHMGDMPVADIETAHVTAALRPLWETKPETATRLRGRIEAVLDFATVHGWREAANPARWRGHLDKVFPRRTKVRAVKHHAALPWQEVGAFTAALAAREGVSADALAFCILTAARSGEVLGARWAEVDLAAQVWTVPADRMKAGKEHRVPLSAPALVIIERMAKLREDDSADALVFPGQRKGRPLSVMAMTMVLRRMDNGHLTVHGFRSAFRDWAGETTAHAREVVEAALAHRTGDKVEQAYARGDLFTKRRKLMEDWAAFCAKKPASVVKAGERRRRALDETPAA